jgi:hypothetical protein
MTTFSAILRAGQYLQIEPIVQPANEGVFERVNMVDRQTLTARFCINLSDSFLPKRRSRQRVRTFLDVLMPHLRGIAFQPVSVTSKKLLLPFWVLRPPTCDIRMSLLFVGVVVF